MTDEKEPGLNDYEAKQEARRKRYEARAAEARQDAESAYARARRIQDGIPFGQPILRGHHSEKRHLADLGRIDKAMRRTIEAGKRAEHYERRAAGVGKGGISSDDPDAIPKLKEELARLEQYHERLKATSKAIRSKNPREALAGLGFRPEQVANLLEPNYLGRPRGVEPWMLSNNAANIRRIRKRVEELEARANKPALPERRVGDVRVVDNAELNRLQLFFPDKPAPEVRAKLKSYGFRWSPTTGAWQAFRSNRATWAAGVVLGCDLSTLPEGGEA